MRNEVFAMVLVVLVVGSLGVGYFTGSNNRQITTATSTVFVSTTAIVKAPSSSCSEPFDYGSVNQIIVLVASPNSTGQICVQYRNVLNNSISLPTTYSTVYEFNTSNHNGCTLSCFITVNSIRVLASQSVVTFISGANPSSETANVTYTITIPPNTTKGIYGIFLLQFCTLFPMVVSQNGDPAIYKSNFTSWYPHQGSCPAQVVGAQVLGIDGFSSTIGFL
jgi:hypothetical protein